MKKLVMLLAAVVCMAACMPKLPDMPEGAQENEAAGASAKAKAAVTLPKVELPVVENENELWQSNVYTGKPVLVVFMGSWCPWCKRTMPAVNALSAKYAGQVEVVGIFVDETPGPVRDAAKEHGFTAKALYNGSELAGTLDVSGLPHVILFDKQHRAVKVWEGYRSNLEDLVSKEVDQLEK